MNIPEELVWLIDDCGETPASGVRIRCSNEQRAEIREFFDETYAELWKKAAEEAAEMSGELLSDNAGAYSRVEDGGVFVSLAPMYVINSLETRYTTLTEPLERTLKKLQKKYPDAVAEGYVAFSASDSHGGDVWQYSIGEEKPTYDFIGKALEDLATDEIIERFTDYVLEHEDEDEIREFVDFLYAYAAWINFDAITKAMSEAAAEDYEELQELIDTRIADLKAGKVVPGAGSEDEDSADEDDEFAREYRQALEAFLAADEYEADLADEGVLPELPNDLLQHGVKSLSEESYPRTAKLAAEGDERAKEILKMMDEANGKGG